MKIKLCPKCKSKKIELFAGLVTGSYHCKKCWYIGPMIIEKEISKLNGR